MNKKIIYIYNLDWNLKANINKIIKITQLSLIYFSDYYDLLQN
jgi:hypothetical protein